MTHNIQKFYLISVISWLASVICSISYVGMMAGGTSTAFKSLALAFSLITLLSGYMSIRKKEKSLSLWLFMITGAVIAYYALSWLIVPGATML